MPDRTAHVPIQQKSHAVDERTQSSLIAIRKILRATDRHAKQLARQTGLTPPQWIVLQIVGDVGEATPKDIAAKARISQATVTALLDKLQTSGLVERTRGQSDRRQIWVTLTKRGEETYHSAPDALQDLFASQFALLPDWEQAMLVAALERIVSLLNADSFDASPLLHSSAIDR